MMGNLISRSLEKLKVTRVGIQRQMVKCSNTQYSCVCVCVCVCVHERSQVQVLPVTTGESSRDIMYVYVSTPPKERPRLQLLPRTKPLEDTSGGREIGEGGSSIYGQAKPVDTTAKDKTIEERLLRVSKFF